MSKGLTRLARVAHTFVIMNVAAITGLVAAVRGASNRLINVEDLSEHEVELLRRNYGQLVELSRRDEELTASHSVEEAAHRHRRKREQRAPPKT